jgi:hypothetical protein
MDEVMQNQRHPRRSRFRKPLPPAEALLGEAVNMLHEVMRQVASLADEESSMDERLDVLDGLGKASTRLATLLKTLKTLGGSSELTSAFDQALNELLQEMGAPPHP